MKPRVTRKQVRNQKSPEVEETTPVRKSSKTRSEKEVNVKVVIERKTRRKEVKVNDKPVVGSINSIPKTRGKTSRPKKNDTDNDNVQIMTYEDDNNNVDIDADSSNSEDEKEEEEDEYQLEDEKEGDDDENETSDSNSSSSELIEHEKPYYGGRKKLPPRAAATQKIDYSENRYYHEFQDYFFTRLDDDNEPKRRKSLSTPTRKRSSRKLYSDDDYYSNISSSSDSQDLRSNKRPRRKRLPNRESKEKRIDYSENKYYRQFDSALNAKFWTDKLPDDEDDEDEDETNNNNKKGKNTKSATVSTTRRTPVSTPQKITKTSSNRNNRAIRSAPSKTSSKIIQPNLSEDEQVSDQKNDNEDIVVQDDEQSPVIRTKKVRGRNTVE